jgi:hypothetical protein
MMFVKHTKDYENAKAPAALYEAMGKFVADAAKKGQFVDGAGLLPTGHGHKVTLRGGKITIIDGPFTESKEIVGGYALIDAQSKDEALDLARQFMELHQQHWPEFEGESEVRPLEAMAQPK